MTENLNLNQVENAVNALKEYFSKEENQSEKNQLFNDRHFRLHFTLKKLPFNCGQKFIDTCLPKKFLDRNLTSICLIVKDLTKHRRRDVEKGVNTFKSYLSEDKNVQGIDEVISLKQLKIEYRTFEAKRKLCSAYDLFLVDDRIANLVTQYLGKTFFEANKFPLPIRISHGDVNSHLEKSLSTVRFYIKDSSSRCSVKFGALEQSTVDLMENINAILKSVEEKLPGGFANVRTINLNANNCSMLPVFVSTESANSVTFKRESSKKVEPIVDSLDTIGKADSDVKVRVWPSGRVDIVDSDKNAKERKNPARRLWKNIKSKNRATKFLLRKRKSNKLDSEKGAASKKRPKIERTESDKVKIEDSK